MLSTNRPLSWAQKMFLQAIMHKGWMDSDTVKKTYQLCHQRFPDESVDESMQTFLRDINVQTRKVDIEIRKGFDEDTCSACYVCISTVENEFLLGTGKYSIKQMDFFKALLRLIVMSDEGCISTMDALNAVDSLSSKIMKQEAVHLIESQWVETDRWLKGVPLLSELSTDPDQSQQVTYLTLGTRAIVELEGYIREVFSDHVDNCNICNRICIRGLSCRGCDCKIHVGCTRTYIAKQRAEVPSCPNKKCNQSRPELLRFRPSN